jgi:cbb3-type cytochrome oxidase maturation protein
MEPTHWALIISFTAVGLAFAAGFVLLAVWAIRNGQFKDVEGVKYRMLQDFDPKAMEHGDKGPDGYRS